MHNVGWERAVIATAIYDPQTMEEAGDLLPADFTDERQDIWSEIMTLYRNGALDQRALIEALRDRGVMGTGALSEEYLAELMQYRGTAMEEYANRVLSASNKRQIMQVAGMIIADAQDENVDDQEAFDAAERRLMTLRRNRSSELGTPLGSIIGVFQDRMQGLLDGTIVPMWIPEIEPLKRVVQFIDEEDYIVLGGRPGEGKSSIMRYMFIEGALAGTPSLLFNLENGELEYAKFALSYRAQVDSSKLKDPRLLSEEEHERVRYAARELANAPLYVKTLGAPSVYEVERISRHHITRYDIKRIGVDYIQLIRNGKENKVSDVTESSQVLRSIPINYRVPLLANAQLSRKIEHRGEGSIPVLADLRESGSLEQDATMVWVPRAVWPTPTGTQLRTFPDNIDESGELYEGAKAIPIKVHVLKNRNGSVGVTRPFLWRKHTNDFNTITMEV